MEHEQLILQSLNHSLVEYDILHKREYQHECPYHPAYGNLLFFQAKVEIYDLIAELAEQGAAVIFTTTEIEEFPRLCHRVIVFHSGRIVGELTGEQISETNIMALAAGG